MTVREYRARSHEAKVSVCHHADEWLLAPQRRTAIGSEVLLDHQSNWFVDHQLNWVSYHGTRPYRPTDAGRVAGSVTGLPVSGGTTSGHLALSLTPSSAMRGVGSLSRAKIRHHNGDTIQFS
jgi:hypothetical protein